MSCIDVFCLNSLKWSRLRKAIFHKNWKIICMNYSWKNLSISFRPYPEKPFTNPLSPSRWTKITLTEITTIMLQMMMHALKPQESIVNNVNYHCVSWCNHCESVAFSAFLFQDKLIFVLEKLFSFWYNKKMDKQNLWREGLGLFVCPAAWTYYV